ncbi:hypothetical protein AKO1_014631 [Acrasis kona]|uniref:3'-5' exonuclease domain-containing protein n=1 Tax=Acrasis kona TaxID=1008807 RepID=A0AAW2Z303_9EUKA
MNECLLIQSNHYSYSEEKEVGDNIVKLFLDKDIQKIVLSGEEDVRRIGCWLKKKLHNVEDTLLSTRSIQTEHNYIDLQLILPGDLSRSGLKKLCSRVLGFYAEKSVYATFSRWSRRTLDQEQKIYAAQDALMTLQIFNTFIEKFPDASLVPLLHPEESKPKQAPIEHEKKEQIDIGYYHAWDEKYHYYLHTCYYKIRYYTFINENTVLKIRFVAADPPTAQMVKSQGSSFGVEFVGNPVTRRNTTIRIPLPKDVNLNTFCLMKPEACGLLYAGFRFEKIPSTENQDVVPEQDVTASDG